MKIGNIEIPDDVYEERLIKKWKPILETVNIPNDYWGDVATYCEKYQDDIMKQPFPALPISIKIISKLDLSKVMFTDFREICKPTKIFMNVNYTELKMIQDKIGIDLLMSMESSMIEQMSMFLNEQIKDDGGIIINGLFETVMVENQPEYKIELTGHVLGFDVYRIKKLKKIRLMISDKN